MQRYVLPTLSVLAILVAWEAAVWLFGISRFVLPSPIVVAREAGPHWRELLQHTSVTAYETVLGFALAFLIAFSSAVLIVYVALAREAIYPLLVIAQVMPKTAIAPVLLLWLGFGLWAKVSLAMLIAFFPIVVTTIQGLQAVEPELLDLVRSLGAGGGKVFYKLRVPRAMPHIFDGLKISITLAVVGAVVGEFIGASSGLGFLILRASYDANTIMMFAAMGLSATLGLIYFGGIMLLERACMPWYVQRREVVVQGYL